MGRRLVPATMVAALLAFATAALTAGGMARHPTWWRAAVALAVLGGIVPMIAAVNIRVVPVFARRDWPSLPWLRAQVALAVAGAWLVYAGRMATERSVAIAGSAVALVSAVIFTINIMRLFRQPAVRPAPPRPFPEQETVDRIAIRFTRLSGIYLLVGLSIGLLIEIHTPSRGRWDLVWAHAMLVGYFLCMASGVCYHVLSRWTGRRWSSVRAIRVHLWVVMLGLPIMLLALATDRELLFMTAGPLQAAGVLLFLYLIAPMALALPEPSRTAVAAAAFCLLIGVVLGGTFAHEPAIGARLRFAHAEVNLFGWTGLLVSGVAYYLVPRFFGSPLRWPRLAAIQLGLLGGGVLLSAIGLARRGYGDAPWVPLAWSHAAVALSFVLLAAILLATVRGPAGTRVSFTPSQPPRTISIRPTNGGAPSSPPDAGRATAPRRTRPACAVRPPSMIHPPGRSVSCVGAIRTLIRD
ncbi:MAG: cbb3-type cytochrome c oxidase subunit I [Thermomicrobiales bacterium]|nr:cbb3-type cytochrome c oxidase subunit I [Thermomicrobiales bacterium]